MKAKATAPGKVILFGEHAVVYGEPALALAVDKRCSCQVDRGSSETTVNGYPIKERYHSYILECINRVGIDDNLKIETESNLPSGAGMGSSAAVSVATIGALKAFKKSEIDEEEVARNAFNIEFDIQGSASPIDTSTSTHGNAVMISEEKEEDFLWKIKKEQNEWYIHHRPIPEVKFVIGDTGVHSSTAPLVRKVRRFYEKSNFAREVIEDIGKIVREGSSLLEEKEFERVGDLMDENHRLLSILGVSHPKLERLVKGARKNSYGAKLTGAGGGGSMIALTDRPEKVAEIIKRRGGTPYILNSTEIGLSYEGRG